MKPLDVNVRLFSSKQTLLSLSPFTFLQKCNIDIVETAIVEARYIHRHNSTLASAIDR